MGVFKRFLLFSCTLLAVTAFFSQGYAALTPSVYWDETNPEYATVEADGGDYSKVNEAKKAIDEVLADPNLGVGDYQYKDDLPGEEGFLAPYYTFTSDSTTDPSGGTITYNGDASVDPYIYSNAYLLVVDGNHTPYWYLFDLSGWDGQEALHLENFWEGTPDEGSISHISLYGSLPPGTVVPVPSSAYLLGSALLLLPAILRRKQKRN